MFNNAKLFDTPMLARKHLEDKRNASKVWFTIMSLTLLKTKFADNKDLWVDNEARGLEYLSSLGLDKYLEELFEEAEGRL